MVLPSVLRWSVNFPISSRRYFLFVCLSRGQLFFYLFFCFSTFSLFCIFFEKHKKPKLGKTPLILLITFDPHPFLIFALSVCLSVCLSVSHSVSFSLSHTHILFHSLTILYPNSGFPNLVDPCSRRIFLAQI